MSTLQDSGFFASRKRRSGVDGGATAEGVNKRPFAKAPVRVEGASSSMTASTSSKTASTSSKTASTASSSSSKSNAARALTPCSESASYVQEAIHKEVVYSREGEKAQSESTVLVYRAVKEAFVIPDDFEKNHKYGPLSGVSHEVRVISAYMAGQLDARSQKEQGARLCMECGGKGHFSRHCPVVLSE